LIVLQFLQALFGINVAIESFEYRGVSQDVVANVLEVFFVWLLLLVLVECAILARLEALANITVQIVNALGLHL
jgi:hypothetical protein